MFSYFREKIDNIQFWPILAKLYQFLACASAAQAHKPIIFVCLLVGLLSCHMSYFCNSEQNNLVTQWLSHSNCNTETVTYWLSHSGQHTVVMRQWSSHSGCDTVVITQWLSNSQCLWFSVHWHKIQIVYAGSFPAQFKRAKKK